MNIIELNKKEIAIIMGGLSKGLWVGEIVNAAILGCIFGPESTAYSRFKTAMVLLGCFLTHTQSDLENYLYSYRQF
jgi:hypothetical protein